ncbi:MAG: hypothetical protein ACXACI_01400 [Candidatus Hodarchaeales archaeon]
MIQKRSLWLAVFIMGVFLLSVPSLSVTSSVVSSPEIETSETLIETASPIIQPLTSRTTTPSPLAINVSFGPITDDGEVDTDGNGKWDYYYINTSIEVLIPGNYVALAFLDFANPDPSEKDHFPALFGMDEGAMFSGGGGGIMPSFGQTTGWVNMAIFFRGDYINATGINWESLNVTGIAVLSLPSTPGPPGLAGYTGYFIGGGSQWQASPYPYNWTSSRYYARDFEPWYSVVVNAGSYWGDSVINKDSEPSYEYLRLEMSVNVTIEAPQITSFRARIEVELHTGAWTENRTLLTIGDFQTVHVYFRSQDLWNDPDFPIGGKFNVSMVEINRWKGDYWQSVFRNETEGPGTEIYTAATGTADTDWQRNPQTAVIDKTTQRWNLTPYDTNDPGTLYDRLQLDIQVNVSAYGFYLLYARFGMRDGYGLESEVGQWLEAGDRQNMSLTYYPQTLRSLPDIGVNVMYATFQAYNKTELELRNGRGDHLDSWTSEFAHPWDNDSLDFDPIAFLESDLPFTNSSLNHLVGDGRVATCMFDATTQFADVLNITMRYPWYADYEDWEGSPYEFEISILDGNWSAIGPDWDARYEQVPRDNPGTYFYPLKRGGFYAGRWILVRVYMRLRDNPLIPQNISIYVDFAGIFDNTAPDPANNWFTFNPPVSDEFGFKISGHAEDVDSGILSVRFFLEPDYLSCFAGTSPWWQYDNTAYAGSWDNRNVTEIYLDENGDFEFYAHPRGDSWSGSQTISMRAVNNALNASIVESIVVTIPNEPDPLPQDMILNGLNWLVAQQQPDGSYMWSRQDERGHDDPPMPTVAFTAWAMLALLQNGSRYDDPIVQGCWGYITSQIQPDGSIQNLWIRAAAYETAIALMGLIPLNISYAVHGASNPTLSNAILDAVNFLISIQNDDTWGYPIGDPFRGGWGYGYPNEQHWADLSNTQWAIIALAAARDYGIPAAQSATVWTLAEEFVRRCSVEGGYWDQGTWISEGWGFAYQPAGTGYSEATHTMTAAGIWTLALMGYDDSDSNISAALQWMSDKWANYIRYDMGGEGYQYYAILSAAKALLLTGHSDSPQYGWMYTSIDDFLNSQVLRDPMYVDQWFWDNTAGSEDPVYATLLAVLSQQIAHGVVGEVDRLAITAECQVHLHVIGPNGTHYGFNYTTGLIDTEGQSTYSGSISYPQQVIIKPPEKGIYTIVIVPLEDGDCKVTVAGVTTDGKTFAIQKVDVNGVVFGGAYATNVTLTTIYGVNIYADPFIRDDGWKTKLDVSYDQLPPIIDYVSQTYTYVSGTTGNFFTFTITDDFPSHYMVHANTTFLGSGTYTSGVPANVSVDGLAVGNWNLSIWANDSFGNAEEVSVLISVVPPGAGDIAAPSITTPSDIIYEEGSTATYTITWGVSDANPATYNITENGLDVKNGGWTNGTISYDVSGLSVGTYTYVLTVRDQAANYASDTVEVEVTYPSSAYSVVVTDPNGGETLSGSYTIKWTAIGPAAASMAFTVEFSSDGGSSWVMLATNVVAQQYEWDTTEEDDGDDYYVRITVVGTTASDMSDDSFEIKNEKKEPSTTSPGFELLVAFLSLAVLAIPLRRLRRH